VIGGIANHPLVEWHPADDVRHAWRGDRTSVLRTRGASTPPGYTAGIIARVAQRQKRSDLLANRVDLLAVRCPPCFVSEVECALFVLQAGELLKETLMLSLVGCGHVCSTDAGRDGRKPCRESHRPKTNLMPGCVVQNR
jgi:hypothetical protein